jgi:hypothetical protein
MFPLNSANIGISDICLPFFVFSPAPAIEHGQAGEAVQNWIGGLMD